MDPKFLSSIPIPSKYKYQSKKLGALTLITFSVLLITILAFLGVFGYKKYLENQIGAFSQSLDDIKSEIEPNFITDVANFADRIEVGERILLNHIVVSSIFKLLEESTLNKVSFSNFSFSVEGQTQGGDGV